MRKLKQKVENLLAEREDLKALANACEAKITVLEKENSILRVEAKKVSPLISENVSLSNKLEELQDQIEQLTDSI